MRSSPPPLAAVQSVQRILEASPAFHQLDGATRASLDVALGQVAGYLRGGPEAAGPPARGLAGRDGGADRGAPDNAAPPVDQGRSTTGRAGELARATLGAVDFPSFMAGLIEGTFQAIVDASIKQLEAYATLLQEVAKTVNEYMRDNVPDGAARDYLADRYSDVFTRDTTGGIPTLKVRTDFEAELPTFFQDLGFATTRDIDSDAVEQVLVPAAQRSIAETRHQTLATMVLLGLNRIVVNDGEITAKLQFHVSASESSGIKFDQKQRNIGTLAGAAGGTTFTGNGIMVNTTSINAQSDINIRTDLTGEVTVRFATDYLPLERFADSTAIQLISQNATVPQTAAPPSVAGGQPAAPPPVATQGRAPQPPRDPWAPTP